MSQEAETPLRGQPLSQPESSSPWPPPADKPLSPGLQGLRVCASAHSHFHASPVAGAGGPPGFSLDQSGPVYTGFLPEFRSVLIPLQEESGLDGP